MLLTLCGSWIGLGSTTSVNPLCLCCRFCFFLFDFPLCLIIPLSIGRYVAAARGCSWWRLVCPWPLRALYDYAVANSLSHTHCVVCGVVCDLDITVARVVLCCATYVVGCVVSLGRDKMGVVNMTSFHFTNNTLHSVCSVCLCVVRAS